MEYYCNVCRKTVSEQEYYFSKNRYHRVLCSGCQSDSRSATKKLQELVRERRDEEAGVEVPRLVTVKDWIAADFETWDKVIKQRELEKEREQKRTKK
jgi:hypothetical protein